MSLTSQVIKVLSALSLLQLVQSWYRWYRQNLTMLIPFVSMLIHAAFSCQLIDYPT